MLYRDIIEGESEDHFLRGNNQSLIRLVMETRCGQLPQQLLILCCVAIYSSSMRDKIFGLSSDYVYTFWEMCSMFECVCVRDYHTVAQRSHCIFISRPVENLALKQTHAHSN